MPLIAVVSGSPAPASRSLALAEHVGAELSARGFAVESVDVRDLPPTCLVGGCQDAPAIHAALSLVARADGIVLITPVYKAAYSGALKAFLDVLPQSGLAGKVVWPIAIGGTLAHVLAIDYALRPVLASMGGPHVVAGLFLLDTWLPRTASGGVLLEGEDVRGRLASGLEQMAMGLRHEGLGGQPVAATVRASGGNNLMARALSE
jgi:FMN reductase